MTAERIKIVESQLKEIKPGKNYPGSVCIVEPRTSELATLDVEDPDKRTVRFYLNSFFVGMYCAIYFPGQTLPHQNGDNDNKKFVRGLIKDIKKAIARNVDDIRIGPLRECKLTTN